MSLDDVVNICPIIRLSREKTGFCCMQSLLVIRFSKLLDLNQMVVLISIYTAKYSDSMPE